MKTLMADSILCSREFHIAQTILSGKSRSFLHNHDFYELFIIQSGEVKHIINNEIYLCRTNTIWLVYPEDKHCFEENQGLKVNFINLAFSKETLAKIASFYHSVSGCECRLYSLARHVELNPVLCKALIEKIQILANAGSNEAAMLSSILFETLCHLTEGEKKYIPYWLSDSCRRMGEKENFSLGLRRFVEICGKTQEYLTRSMQLYYQKTPTEFVNELRLSEGASLLRNTDMPVLEVMYDCGFNNVSHFNKLFKDKYGLSPLKYRQTNLNVIRGFG